jgi:hypothetical protein
LCSMKSSASTSSAACTSPLPRPLRRTGGQPPCSSQYRSAAPRRRAPPGAPRSAAATTSCARWPPGCRPHPSRSFPCTGRPRRCARRARQRSSRRSSQAGCRRSACRANPTPPKPSRRRRPSGSAPLESPARPGRSPASFPGPAPNRQTRARGARAVRCGSSHEVGEEGLDVVLIHGCSRSSTRSAPAAGFAPTAPPLVADGSVRWPGEHTPIKHRSTPPFRHASAGRGEARRVRRSGGAKAFSGQARAA